MNQAFQNVLTRCLLQQDKRRLLGCLVKAYSSQKSSLWMHAGVHNAIVSTTLGRVLRRICDIGGLSEVRGYKTQDWMNGNVA